MAWRTRLQQYLIAHLERLNLSLAHPDALWQLAALGVISGFIAGAIMVMLRLCIELPQAVLLGADNIEGYEQLSWLWRLLLPSPRWLADRLVVSAPQWGSAPGGHYPCAASFGLP